MSGTTKAIVIVGAVGVGVYVVLKAVAPSSGPKPGYSSGAPAVVGGTFISVLGGLMGALGSASSTNGPGGSNPNPSSQPNNPQIPPSSAIYQPGDSFGDYTTGLFGPGINPDGTGA